jgi:RimJ/RimL family protein N-acetyltransferase
MARLWSVGRNRWQPGRSDPAARPYAGAPTEEQPLGTTSRACRSRDSRLMQFQAMKDESVRTTDRLFLRPWSREDEGHFAELGADPQAMRYITGGQPLSAEDVEEISARSLEMWRKYGFGPWAAIERSTGAWVGRIGLSELPHWPGPDKIEVAFELKRRFWGQGLATEGGLEALEFGFRVHRLKRLISATRADHSASRRVMEKIGLAYMGVVPIQSRDGNSYDVAWYASDRDTWLDAHRPRRP